MALERRLRSRPGQRLPQGVTDLDRGGIDAVPVLHATARPRQIDLLCPSLGQGVVRQDGPQPCEGLGEPPRERRAGHAGPLTLERRPQEVGLGGPARCPGRDHHRPHPQPQRPLALPLHHTERPAQAIDVRLWQDRLKHLSDVLSRPVHAPRRLSSLLALLVNPPEEENTRRSWSQGSAGHAIMCEVGFSGHVWRHL